LFKVAWDRRHVLYVSQTGGKGVEETLEGEGGAERFKKGFQYADWGGG